MIACHGGQIFATAHVQFPVDLVEVLFHRALGDEQFSRDRPIAVAARRQGRDLRSALPSRARPDSSVVDGVASCRCRVGVSSWQIGSAWQLLATCQARQAVNRARW
jgi:hypothetical protein